LLATGSLTLTAAAECGADAIRKIQSPWATSMRDASRSSGRMMQALG
jgi:hypothetical protein